MVTGSEKGSGRSPLLPVNRGGVTEREEDSEGTVGDRTKETVEQG